MLRELTQQEAAQSARRALAKALLKIAEAEVEISSALATLDMFEQQFGYKPETVTTTTLPKGDIKFPPFAPDTGSRKKQVEFDWHEVTGRDNVCGIEQDPGYHGVAGPRCILQRGHKGLCSTIKPLKSGYV